MKVLLIEDSGVVRKKIKRQILKSFSGLTAASILEAGTNHEVWDLVGQAKSSGELPDIILCDWNIPGLDGVNFVKEIKQDPVMKGIPIIMVTAESRTSKVKLAIEAGINDYLVKPFNPVNLIQKMNNIIFERSKMKL
ncbi:response regulator [Candidatus Riflebacteria bacterium]